MASILQTRNKNEVFNNGNLKIHDNLISFSTGVAQVSNVSRVYIARLPQKSYLPGIIVVLVGLYLITMRGGIPVGLIIAAIGAGLVYFAYKKNSANKFGLFIEMNSGSSLIFPSGELNFLYDAANFLANIIEGNLHADNYSITFTDNSIHDITGAVVSGGNIERMITCVEK